ncbi:MAG: type II secretion system F family protein [Gammaproteobacteria bacterium]|nr:type II secretion system F family protein [Gammaproteobacteria bacterium]
MPKFSYQARVTSGAMVSGILEAATEHAVANQLIETGTIPIKIEPYEERRSSWEKIRRKLGLDNPGLDELILFSRQCNALNRAGVPIIRGFRMLAESYRNPVFSETINEIADDLESGRDLSSSMARHPKIFSPLYVNMIRVGETTGRMDEAFQHLHNYYERDRKTLNQLKAAFRYPSFVLIAIIIATIIIMTFVIPKFTSFYAKNKLTLPVPTKIIMAISGFMVDYWPFLLVGVLAAGFGFHHYINTEKGRLWWDEKKLRFWVVGDIALRATLARFSRTLAMALSAGVPVLQAITVTSRALGNEYVATKVISMRESIERGDSMLRSASKQQIFTPITLQMFAVGEESGRMDEMLEEVAGFYEREVDYDVAHLNATIEPLLTVALAGLVLLLMLGVFLPMWNLVDMIK